MSTRLQRARARAAAVASMVVLVGLVVGVPLLLAAFAGAPWTAVGNLGRAMSVSELNLALWQPLLALVSWLWWASLIVDVVQAASTVHDSKQGSFTAAVMGAEDWSRSLIAGLLLTSLSSPALSHPAAPSSLVAEVVPEPYAGEASPQMAAGPRSIAQSTNPTKEVRVHGHGSTSTLWGLAERHLGAGTRWPEIWALNEGRRQSDGSVMETPELLRPGWSILVPTDPTRTAANVISLQGRKGPSQRAYVVARGDRLADIAERFLGHADAYPQIQQLNRGIISDPDHIETGDTLTLPARSRDHGSIAHARGRAHLLTADMPTSL